MAIEKASIDFEQNCDEVVQQTDQPDCLIRKVACIVLAFEVSRAW